MSERRKNIFTCNLDYSKVTNTYSHEYIQRRAQTPTPAQNIPAHGNHAFIFRTKYESTQAYLHLASCVCLHSETLCKLTTWPTAVQMYSPYVRLPDRREAQSSCWRAVDFNQGRAKSFPFPGNSPHIQIS